MKTKKQKAQADKNQPSLYGDVDELYNLLSAHESADKDAVTNAQKRVTSAEENLAEAKAQLDNTQRAMSIVERRLEELKPTKAKKWIGKIEKEKPQPPSKKEEKKEEKKKEAAKRKARLTGKRDKPEGEAPKPTPPPPQKNVKKKK